MASRIKLPFNKSADSKKVNEIEITETLRKEDFSLTEIVRYGFPYRPSTLAYDPVQKILAIGTKTGVIKIYGGVFVECSLQHPSEVEIVQLIFRINEGALISACRDNYIHLWNLRQKRPVIANSLRFMKEKISRCLLPLAFNSKWLLVGTYGGNVYVVNLDTFTLSSYTIMWNNAIGMSKSVRPGVVVDLCQNPDDPTRLYIGFSTHLSTPNTVPIGHVVCWNLQQKASEGVYTLSQGLTSLSWHYEGRQFMCSHCDGSLSVWNLRSVDKAVSVNYPLVRLAKEDTRQFGPVSKVVWTAMKSSGDSFFVFSGGMPHPNEQKPTSASVPLSKPSSYFLTIHRGQSTNVLLMDNPIVDFHVISPSPHIADVPDPSAVIVLLENDLAVIDLKSDNYPLFESVHTMDLHESPVTFCDYITEPNGNFYQSLLRLQSKQTTKRTYSQQENPFSGGRSGSTIFGYNELILTGHADGSIKFWDASGSNLAFLYKLRTNRLFDRIQNSSNPSSAALPKDNNLNYYRDSNSNIKFETKSTRANSNSNDEQQFQMLLNEDNPFSIYSIKTCCDGKYLIAAGRGGHVTLFKFTGSELEKADEGLGDLACLEIPIFRRNLTNDHDEPNMSANELQMKQNLEKKECKSLFRAKMGYRRMAGYQPELVCLLSWLPSDKPPLLTDMAINSKYGLLIFGLDNGLVVVDYLSQFILMNMATGDLYGTSDPFQRTALSPKRRGPSNESNNDDSNMFSYEYQPSSPPNNSSTLLDKRSQALATDTNSGSYKPLVIDLPRSSSTSSLDNVITNESICAIQFSESFTYKNDFTISPSVWLGTSTGSVIVINLNIIYEPRNISVVPSGTVFRLSGRMLHISFLDQKGVLIPSPSEKWETKKNKSSRMNDGIQDFNPPSVLPGSGTSSPATTSPPPSSIQYAVFCSSKEARVIALPAQVCLFKQKIYESLGTSASSITRASVVKIGGSICLTCYLSAGRIHVYSLPSLRELYTTNLEFVVNSFRSTIASTFTMTNRGHGLYMSSPNEIQKFTIASDIKEQINEMLCELYSPSVSMPEAPKQNFFTKLFASNVMVDPDLLFGETAGKAPAGVIKREDINVNMDQLRGKATSTNSVIHDTRMQLIERGQKLGEVEMASKQMSDRAEDFARLAHNAMIRQKEKAEWSWPFTSKK